LTDVADELRWWLAEELGSSVRIENLRRTSAGYSRENWVFDAVVGGDRHALIARRDPVGSVLETDRRVEAAVLEALEKTDIPSPRLRWVDLAGERLERPVLVMDLSPGICDGFVLNGDRPLMQRLGLAHQIYGLLAQIHLLDWRGIGLGDVLEDPGPAAAAHAVDHWESELQRVQLEPEPELAVVIAWLRANAPESPTTVLVHGDFKPGNLLVDGDEVSAILDWETAHLGDPHEDLGWVTNPLRAREHRIPEVWQPDHLFLHWSNRTGMVVDEGAVHWWRVLANLKLAVIVLTGNRAFVEHRMDRFYQSPVFLYAVMLDMISDRRAPVSL
jgi:aminoglycoside phosphotransferase (APT) family kinase protein